MFFEKILMGVTLAAPIGPVTIEMIKRGLRQGFWSAFIIRLGGGVANFLCLLIACLGVNQINQYPLAVKSISLLGAAVLLYMGFKNLTQKRLQHMPIPNEYDQTLINGLVTGFTVGLLNPIGIMFWLGIFATEHGEQAITVQTFTQNLLIILGVLSWGALVAFSLACLKRVINVKTLNTVTLLSGIVLIGFGVKVICRTFL